MNTYQLKFLKEEIVRKGESGWVSSTLSIKFEFGYTIKNFGEWQDALRECGYYYSPVHRGYFNPEFGFLTHVHEICQDFNDDPGRFREWHKNIQQDPDFKEKLKKVGELMLWSLRNLQR
jgi:hypothetical protein